MNELSRCTVAGLIPARGGSKGVPGKNMRLLAGRPLIWYTIHAALQAQRLSFVVVSTEDAGIAAYVQGLGVDVLRHPVELSTDDAPTFPVIQWDLHELRRRGQTPDVCVALRATSPLRTSADIDEAIALLNAHSTADSVVSVGPAVGIHPVRLKRVLGNGRLEDAFSDVFGSEGFSPKQRQQFEQLHLRNGAIYATKAHVIEHTGLWGACCLAYEMPEERSININTEFQLRVAELLILAQRSAAP